MNKSINKYQFKHNRQVAVDKALDDLKVSIKAFEKLFEDANTLGDKVLMKYVELNNVKKTAKYFRDKAVKTKSGHTFSAAIVRKFINKGSEGVNKDLLKFARDVFRENELMAKIMTGSATFC
jgi:hypothetical protein